MLQLRQGSQVDDHGEGVVEIGSVDIGGASEAQIDSVACLIVNNFCHQSHSVEQGTCVYHHFVSSILVAHDLHQVVVFQFEYKLLESKFVGEYFLPLVVLGRRNDFFVFIDCDSHSWQHAD